MLSRKLSAIVVMTCAFAVSGGESKPVVPLAQPNPDAKAPVAPVWVKERLKAVDKQLDKDIKDLVGLYQHLHANPELSLMETKTAARLAEEIKSLGYEVTEKVGGNGIVAVMKNGPGSVVLIRTDLDALPIIEQTGVAYASKVKVKDKS